MKRIMALISAACVAMTAFVGCDTPTIPNNDPVEISLATLNDSASCHYWVTNPDGMGGNYQSNGESWTDSGLTSNGIVWTVESVYLHSTEPNFKKVLKVHTNRYENGSTEQLTWFINLHFDGTNWGLADTMSGLGACGNWTAEFVAWANSNGYTL